MCFVKTITVSGATPIVDIPNDDDDEIIIDDNRIVEQTIQLAPGDTTAGTFNTFRFQKVYNYDNYNYGQNEDNVVCTVTDYIGNTSTAETIILINKVDNAPPTIVSLTSDKPMLNLSNSNNTEVVTFFHVVVDSNISTNDFPGTSLIGNTGSTPHLPKHMMLLILILVIILMRFDNCY